MPKTLEVLGAYDEELIRKIPVTSKREMEKALSDARALADNPSERIPLPKRIEILERTRLFVEKNYDRIVCLLYTSPSPRDRTRSRMPSSA